MLRKAGKRKSASKRLLSCSLWLIIILVSSVFTFISPQKTEAAPAYIKEGESVYTNSNDTYIKVTPHTLTDSGWVTVNFSSSKFTGDVDICFGFNGVDQVKTVKSESWESYEKTDKGKATVVTDWKPSTYQVTVESKDYLGAKNWQSKKHTQAVVKDQLYTTRFWIEIPFSGLKKVEGKYNVAVKPSSLTMEQAVTQGKIAILDPWYNSGWGYRKQFTVTGSTAGAQTNYQVRLAVNYLAGADSGITVYLDSKSQTDFDDLRFTKADGVTLLDYWVDSYTASTNAVVWVELDSIPASPSTITFYMYYGNSTVASASNGTNTFVIFDNFERTTGDSIAVGSAWVVLVGTSTISIDHNYSIGGTKSGIANLSTFVDWTVPIPAGSFAMGWHQWKEDLTGTIEWQNGNTSERATVLITAAESIDVIAGATGVSTTADAWRQFEIYNVNFTTNVYSVQHQWTVVIAGTATQAVPDSTWRLHNADAVAGHDIYIDDTYARKFINPEPTITAWATAETSGGLTSVLSINNAKVINSYLEEDDWLIVCLYLNKYEPYYTNSADVQSLFYIQLYDVTGTVLIAQTKCPEWGYKPGAIYLSAVQAASLEWGLAYIVRVYGDFTGYPYVTYTLTPADWLGDDLLRLDSWIRGTVAQMETYYTTATYTATLTTYVSGKGLVLNDIGGPIFDTCIPACSSVRPGCFQIVTSTPGYTKGTFTQTYASSLVWQTLLGPYLTATFTNLGNQFSISGSTVGAMLGFGFYTVVAMLCFPPGSAIAAISIPSVILLAVWYTGLLPLASLGFILAVMAFLLIFFFYWLKTA